MEKQQLNNTIYIAHEFLWLNFVLITRMCYPTLTLKSMTGGKSKPFHLYHGLGCRNEKWHLE